MCYTNIGKKKKESAFKENLNGVLCDSREYLKVILAVTVTDIASGSGGVLGLQPWRTDSGRFQACPVTRHSLVCPLFFTLPFLLSPQRLPPLLVSLQDAQERRPFVNIYSMFYSRKCLCDSI